MVMVVAGTRQPSAPVQQRSSWTRLCPTWPTLVTRSKPIEDHRCASSGLTPGSGPSLPFRLCHSRIDLSTAAILGADAIRAIHGLVARTIARSIGPGTFRHETAAMGKCCYQWQPWYCYLTDCSAQASVLEHQPVHVPC